jgi:RNase P protein component
MKQLHILLDISKQLPWRRGIPRHNFKRLKRNMFRHLSEKMRNGYTLYVYGSMKV